MSSLHLQDKRVNQLKKGVLIQGRKNWDFKVGTYLPNFTASHFRRPQPKYGLL